MFYHLWEYLLSVLKGVQFLAKKCTGVEVRNPLPHKDLGGVISLIFQISTPLLEIGGYQND